MIFVSRLTSFERNQDKKQTDKQNTDADRHRQKNHERFLPEVSKRCLPPKARDMPTIITLCGYASHINEPSEGLIAPEVISKHLMRTPGPDHPGPDDSCGRSACKFGIFDAEKAKDNDIGRVFSQSCFEWADHDPRNPEDRCVSGHRVSPLAVGPGAVGSEHWQASTTSNVLGSVPLAGVTASIQNATYPIQSTVSTGSDDCEGGDEGPGRDGTADEDGDSEGTEKVKTKKTKKHTSASTTRVMQPTTRKTDDTPRVDFMVALFNLRSPYSENSGTSSFPLLL
ncbi:hypothetical protein BDN72DRAFT_859852 [Pluteus cervinus]|uniref:Uncharacterized protein n=1 Tax=Pluteus cervinus TaxID=181527 RepID=A0ACD3AMP0_9AGAR|nr:hypothetical protein BDN72DRAFT_859852 [Pluteus cervinus]